ncbi:3-deoxy-D-manno-octulosonic acid kinase [Luteimonas sp. MC1572]|uniref:3-deoxy-D-manno-octulosonic acid kinase n=1 Tax=Luteimonas sp. MC1572 TaxID=2799325 RepID=UPI0018F0F782|nr:3-deoxy-D-manno-octulosonic acid kinase [Luteimonas sp. MC1572]MBJ6981083.1 3-deoxy-D-manno-octulosonic acid kinase [Luteimonas sp. MC1572]QQO02420.1 3-deoxy-D-manno-octulosonic acid kinase [Luteimonas sp. MC1572]
MAIFDATESLTPFRAGPRERGVGSILFDQTQLRQADPRWFDPEAWGARATPVSGSGRGGAWFIEGASHGPCVLRHYLRGGLAAAVSRDRHLWRGVDRVRSFAEFRLLRELRRRGLPVPEPIAASYLREGIWYRASILMARLVGVRSLAALAAQEQGEAPWEATGELIARFHREGLDHADLNAHNILFDEAGRGWLIDLDRSRMTIPATAWRTRNLARLERSLLKLRGERSEEAVRADFARLRAVYDKRWARGI